MFEEPYTVILAVHCAQRLDGYYIGSNDLTQLFLGIDRDSTELLPISDARDEAVKRMIAQVVKVGHENGCKVGICGQAPSDHPDFAAFLVECGKIGRASCRERAERAGDDGAGRIKKERHVRQRVGSRDERVDT